MSAAGTWTLRVDDRDAYNDRGTLNSWTLRVKLAGPSTNQAPVAQAGADQTLPAGTTVTLDGSGSFDPDGDALSYTWTQVVGSQVTLSGASSAQASFTAPSVTAPTQFIFQLVVSDGQLQSNADQTTVTVQPVSSEWLFDQAATDTPKSIPDYNSTGITSSISVGANFPVSEIEVDLDISHTYIGDLRVILTCPGGSSVYLHNRTGGSANDIHTTYPASICMGQSAAGTWSLKVIDLARYDLGSLDNWQLRIR